jgi:hypothetical protein
MRFRTLVCGMFVLATACHHRSKPVAQPVPAPSPASRPAEEMEAIGDDARIYYDDATAFTDSLRMIIQDVDTWQSVWARATRRQATAPPLPAVDFQRQTLLLVSAGRMRTGDEIHVDSIGTRGGQRVAVVRTIVQCQTVPAPAYPLEIVRVARAAGALTFVERRVKSQDC